MHPKCPACGCSYSSLTGAVFKHTCYELARWVFFIHLMRYSMPLGSQPRKVRHHPPDSLGVKAEGFLSSRWLPRQNHPQQARLPQ